jgi:hypothetical protein
VSDGEKQKTGCVAFPDRGECSIHLSEREVSLLQRLSAATEGHEPDIAALWEGRLDAGTNDAPDRTSGELLDQVT